MSHISDADLQAYLDDELSDHQRSLVHEHVGACAACGGRLGAFQSLYAEVESLPDAPLHQDLVPGVLARLAPQPAISTRVRWLLLAELALGVGALATALGWLKVSPPSWIAGLVPPLQVWVNFGDLVIWLRSLAAPVQAGISAFGSLSASATAPLAAALPVTGWAVILAGLLLAGLAANGVLLTRAAQPRREDRGSA